ncbi:FecR domain-containing protein [Sphingobium sp. CECT 9361]|uniref:FecR family protein n=1 Tax=Sphingobium sp. CECT 9361 TaxID=2845384 RepID=UPI001E608557|nr:FecR domain-containing protein [Sphingobium sp. CECT 9361]CAH0357109.1 hypothetical protein SPH9361_04758 [Sphingobium sp. CECT 9361]
MADDSMNPFEKGQLKREATDWFIQMRAPDAEQHRAEFERWLAMGAVHRAAYNRVANLYVAGKAVDWDALPPPAPVRATIRRTLFAVAGSVLLIGFLSWRLIFPASVPLDRSFERAERDRPSTAAQAQFVTRLGEIRTIRLPDGSHVTLDTDTLLSVDFRADERELRLEHGRARFEVEHEGRPFVVDAGEGEVVARGTVFDVSLWDDRTVHVQLLRGAVDVRLPAWQRTRRSVPAATLRPGQALSFNEVNGSLAAAVRTQEVMSNWPSGAIEFSAATLREVVDVANRYSVTKIILTDPKLESMAVSGVFHVDNPERLGRALSLLLNLKLTKDRNEIRLGPQ